MSSKPNNRINNRIVDTIPRKVQKSVQMSSLTLSFEIARQDAPLFRANLQRIEDETEKLSAWIESLTRSLRMLVDELVKENEASSAMAAKVLLNSELIDADLSVAALRTFADALQCTFSFKQKMVDDLVEYMLAPLQDFNKVQVREMREMRRLYERAFDRYETALVKFTGLSKAKEASSLREDAFQLYEIRKVYISISFQYSVKAIAFKNDIDRMILYHFTEAMDGEMSFYSNAVEIYKGLQPRLDKIKASMEQRNATVQMQTEMLEQRRLLVEDEALELCKPSTALPLAAPSSTLKPIIDPASKIEKEGYLFKRTQPKSPLIPPTWVRRWCFIKNGNFGFQSVARQRGFIVSSSLISVLLCEIRIDDKQDRRYCLEIVSSKRSYLLQAETEQNLKDWLQVFEAAKLNAMKLSQEGVIDLQDDTTLNDHRFTFDDEEWDETIPVSIVKTMDGNTLPPAFVHRKIKYDDEDYERCDAEMVDVLKELAGGQLLDSFPGALMKNVNVRGRFYLTAANLCFYSNVLSFVTTVCIPWPDMLAIQQKDGVIGISTRVAQYSIQTFYRDDDQTYGVISALFWNTRADDPLTSQELYDTIRENYRDGEISEELNEVEVNSIMAFRSSSVSGSVAVRKSIPITVEWPADVEIPAGEVNCGCADHFERSELDITLNVSAKRAFDLIYGDEFITSFHAKLGHWDVSVANWDQETRNVKWQFKVNNPMTKIKDTECLEVQSIRKRREHLSYVVDNIASTANMPYGDTFQTCSKYCLTYKTQTSCRLVCTIEVKFLKSTMMKSIIKSQALKGLGDYIKDFSSFLRERIGENSATSENGDDNSAESVKSTSMTPVSYKSPTLFQASEGDSLITSPFRDRLYLIVTLLLIFSIVGNAIFLGGWMRSSHGTKVVGIYLKDIGDTLLEPSINKTFNASAPNVSRRSVGQFIKQLSANEIPDVGSLFKKSSAIRLDLLDRFRQLNQIEEWMMRMEYIRWMRDQIRSCHRFLAEAEDNYQPLKAKLDVTCRRLNVELYAFLATLDRRE